MREVSERSLSSGELRTLREIRGGGLESVVFAVFVVGIGIGIGIEVGGVGEAGDGWKQERCRVIDES